VYRALARVMLTAKYCEEPIQLHEALLQVCGEVRWWRGLGGSRVAGTDVGDIIGAANFLAEKQNERQATAVRLLPRLHWALLYVIGGLFVCTFLLFETGGGFSDEGRHALFTVLCSLMTFVLCVSPCAVSYL
jgi:hypothetical protein